MAIRINRNKPNGTACGLCNQVAVCGSLTMLENNSGFGWHSAGTANVCHTCLLDMVEEVEGAERVNVYAAQLRETGVVLPRNPTLEALTALMVAGGLPLAAEQVASTEPAEGSARWWRGRAATAGVPVPDWMASRADIEERIDLWADAKVAGIDLYEGMDNDQAREVLDGSRRAKAEARARAVGLPETPAMATLSTEGAVAGGGFTVGTTHSEGDNGGGPDEPPPATGAVDTRKAKPRGHTAPVEGRIVPD